ncbi:MAG: hypothetical protein JXR69_02325 [Candidatus Delongbacteria bacterium]|nr:hypothetical protein [Candidatus Delongbacteria bacterium]
MKTLIFDLGNVLINVDTDKLINKLKDTFVLSIEEMENFEKAHHHSFYTGRISGMEFYQKFKSTSQTDVTYDDFATLWSNIFSYNKEMIEYISKLPVDDIRIVIASNTDPIHIGHIKENFPLPFEYSEFFSYDEGFIKPEDGFYIKLISKYSIDLKNAIFFDDLEQNIKGALKNRITSYLHKDTSLTIKRIQNFLGL